MRFEQELLVEQELCDAIRAFHDLDDKRKRNAYSKEYFWKFCQEHNIDPQEAFSVVERVLKEKSKTGFSNYSDSVTVLKKDIKKKQDDEGR